MILELNHLFKGYLENIAWKLNKMFLAELKLLELMSIAYRMLDLKPERTLDIAL